MKLLTFKQQQSGFSLIEMAIVLVIVGLLIAGLMLPMTAQLDQKNYNDTQKELSDLRDALVGYALSHTALDGRPFLPCPDSSGDGFENRDAAGNCVTVQGAAPWVTLGLGQSDSWGRQYIYRVSNVFSNSNIGFSLASVGDNQVRETVGGILLASNVPAVIVSKGKGGLGLGLDEQENSNGNGTFISRLPSDVGANAFDDLVIWLPATVLFNRMVTAGKLP